MTGAITEGEGSLWEMAARATYLSARAHMAVGAFRTADEILQGLRVTRPETIRGWRDETRPLLTSRTLRALGECAEQRGRLDLARGYYQLAAQESPSVWARRLADYAQTRVAALDKLTPAVGAAVAVLPDDRTTRGYWPVGYGRLSYALLAQNFLVDRNGGVGPHPAYSFCTTNPKEPSRLWVSKKQDDDPAALWDPVNKCFRSANRDDCGEQVPPGQGPDLLLSLAVPAGQYMLGLYFANDHNYYEPNRRFTISVTDASGALQAVTTVENFAGGVFKRFVLQGGTTYRFRVWRNLSMNTLISGIFLDPAPAAGPVPYPKAETTPPALVGVAGSYAAIARDMSADPLKSWYTQARLRSLAGRLESLVGCDLVGPTTTGLSAMDQAAAWWMLSECYRLIGQPPRGEAAFDRYIAALEAGSGASDESVRVLPAVARALYDAAGGPRAQNEQQHRLAFRPGEHRGDRVWSAYLQAAARACGTDGAKKQAALLALATSSDPAVTPFAKQETFATLQREFPEAPASATVLASVGEASKDGGDKQHARQLLEQALAAGPAEEDRPLVLAKLLALQVSTEVTPDQVKTTYLLLAPFGEQRRYASLAQTGLLQVAEAYRLAGQKRQALEALKQYQAKYGDDARVQASLARLDTK